MIPESVIDAIQERSSIVDVISQFVPLKKAGRSFKAPCPFHSEKSASFFVSPEKQIFHCFGCNTGGNVFSFLMKFEKLSFREAVGRLAEKSGIVIMDDEESKGARERLPLAAANKIASEFYQQYLWNQPRSSGVWKYIASRGLTDDTVKAFGLGYAPAEWDTLNRYARQHFSDDVLEKAGLIIRRQDASGYYDRFRNRLMFPIVNLKGEVAGFGARVLDDTQPKYLNSPETEIFQKGRYLYALNWARDALKGSDPLVVVEGYMDVIACHAVGVRNVAAPLGTALTREQVRQIKRFSDKVIVLFDDDEAGQRAASRGIEVLVEESMDIRVANLEAGEDPDSYIRLRGVEAFKQKVFEASRPFFEFKLMKLLARWDVREAQGRTQIAMEMLTTIARVPNAILKTTLLERLSQELGVPTAALSSELRKKETQNSGGSNQSTEAAPMIASQARPVQVPPAERMILGLSVVFPSCLRRVREELPIQDFSDLTVRQVMQMIYEEPEGAHPAKLLSRFKEEATVSLVSRAIHEAETVEDADRALKDCLGRMREHQTAFDARRLQEKIRQVEQGGDRQSLAKLLQEFQETQKKKTVR